MEFSQYRSSGKTALTIKPSDQAAGYYRREREGYHWRRDNITVDTGKRLARDIDRVIQNLKLGLGHSRHIERPALYARDPAIGVDSWIPLTSIGT